MDEAAWSQTARRAVKREQGCQPPPSVMRGLRIKVKKHRGVVGPPAVGPMSPARNKYPRRGKGVVVRCLD